MALLLVVVMIPKSRVFLVSHSPFVQHVLLKAANQRVDADRVAGLMGRCKPL